MSSSKSIRIPFQWSNIDVFTFGKSSIYGYDLLNHCLIVHSLSDLNHVNNISNDRLHLSSSPSWPIRRMILNENETILALLADRIAYLVYLPHSNIDHSKTSPSKGCHSNDTKIEKILFLILGSRLCPVTRITPPGSSSSANINCSLIDFVWLTSNHFAMVYSIPTSSECHVYALQASKANSIEHLQTFPVGVSSRKNFGTPNKKISLHQPVDIVKLDVTKRRESDVTFILLFAMKSDGDMFLLEIDQNELLSNKRIDGDFQGPLRILPSTFDNYGADHSQSTFICLGNSNLSLLIFTRDHCQLNQCLILSPSSNEYYLFAIDLICLPKNDNGQILTSIVPDRFSSKNYFICDSAANVYSLEISWLDQIQQGLKQLQPTHIQHLINGTNSDQKVIQMGCIETNNQERYLATIVKSTIDQRTELILVRSGSSEKCASDFVDRIRSLLSRTQSIPSVTLANSSTTISDADLEKNLMQFVKVFTEEYIAKQDKVREELENKQQYLLDFERTQSNENEILNERFEQIHEHFQTLTEQYQQECSRRQRLASQANDLLSVIEQHTPVLSDAETRMQEQLKTYQIQIDVLKENISFLQQFLSSNQNHEQFDNLSLENLQNFIQSHRTQIDQMKKQLQAIQIK